MIEPGAAPYQLNTLCRGKPAGLGRSGARRAGWVKAINIKRQVNRVLTSEIASVAFHERRQGMVPTLLGGNDLDAF